VRLPELEIRDELRVPPRAIVLVPVGVVLGEKAV
jgi:hypothetical protein